MAKTQRANPILYLLAVIGALVVIVMAISAVSSLAKLKTLADFNALSGAQSLGVAFISTVLSFEFFLAVVIFVLLVFFAVRFLSKRK